MPPALYFKDLSLYTAHMRVHITRTDGVLWSGDADALTAPGTLGELTVLPHHVPLVSTLRAGTLSVKRGGSPVFRHEVTHGVLEVTAESVTVLL